MTLEAQRIAIAEACGYSHIVKRPISGWDGTLRSKEMVPVPDYLLDLNAMHEAEKVLRPAQITDYVRNLAEIVERYWTDQGKRVRDFDNEAIMFSTLNATAAQRAEAFLRTLNLWRE